MEQQMEMFTAPARPNRREAAHFHSAVIFMRKRGVRVHRVSAHQSKINNSLVDNRMLVRLAASLGWSRQ